MSTIAPDLSVIIPTYNRPRELRRCLRSLQSQEEGNVNYEILVVFDGGVPDRIIEDEFRDSRIAWIILKKNVGQPAAQNEGVNFSRGELLAFLDDDATACPGWINAITGYFRDHPDIDAVLGRILPLATAHVLARMRQTIYDRRHRRYTSPEMVRQLRKLYALSVSADIPMSDHISGGNFAIRRSTLRQLGGFPENLRLGGDETMSLRLLNAGHAIGYNPLMRICHHHNTRLSTLFRNNFKEGRDRQATRRGGGGGERSAAHTFGLLSNLLRAPFRICGFPEMFEADRNKLLIYFIYTGVQCFDALGQIYEYLSSAAKHDGFQEAEAGLSNANS